MVHSAMKPWRWAQAVIAGRAVDLISQFLSWLLLATGVGTAAFMVYLTVLSYSAVPWMDPWFFFYQVDQGHLSWWKLLWVQHNGHRIVFPKLLYLADLEWFHGSSILLLVSSYVVQSLHCAVFLFLMRRLKSFGPVALRSAAGLVLFCLFCPAQREDFIQGWQITYVLPMFLTTLAIAAFAISGREKPSSWFSRWILVGWIAALVGGFSLLSGFLIFPMLCVEAIALGLPRRTWLTTAFLGIGVLAVNAIGFQLSVETSLGDAQYPRRLLAFFNLLMAESWEPVGSSLGMAVAWIGVFTCLAIVFRQILRSTKALWLETALSVIALTAVGATAMTAVGRWNTGFTNRYEEPVFLFWAAFALLLFAFTADPHRRMWLVALQVLLAVIMIASTGQLRALTIEANYHREALNVAGAALVSGVRDPNAVAFIAMPVDWTFGEIGHLKERKAALYAERPASLLGSNVSQAYRIFEKGCTGRLKSSSFMEDSNWPGLSIRGAAWNTRDDKPMPWLVITDAAGNIVGLGANDSVIHNNSGDQQTTWSAFAPTQSKDAQFKIYGVVSEREVCVLSGLPVVRGVLPLPQFPESAAALTPLWSPAKGDPSVSGGTATIRDGVLAIRSNNSDTQAFFDTGVDLRQFSALVIKAKFARVDTVEMYFGRQIDGLGIQGSISTIDQWVMLRANVGVNPYWKTEGGSSIRFDPTGAQGAGAVTLIAGIWGSKTAAEFGADFFEAYQAPVQSAAR